MSEWTVDTLKEHFDVLHAADQDAVKAALAAQKEAVAAALAASDKAVEKAEATAERWRASANEWRGAMSDRDRELPSRRELLAETSRLDAQIKPLSDYMTGQQGRSQGVSATTAALYAAVGLVVAVLAVAAVIYSRDGRSAPAVVTVTVTTTP